MPPNANNKCVIIDDDFYTTSCFGWYYLLWTLIRDDMKNWFLIYTYNWTFEKSFW